MPTTLCFPHLITEKDLYVSSKEMAVTYSRHPKKGRLNPRRAIKGLPCFEKIDVKESRSEKKVLLLADPCLRLFPDRLPVTYKNLQNIQKQGFKIAGFKEGRIQYLNDPLSQQEFDESLNAFNADISIDELIKKAAIDLSLSQQQLFSFNYFTRTFFANIKKSYEPDWRISEPEVQDSLKTFSSVYQDSIYIKGARVHVDTKFDEDDVSADEYLLSFKDYRLDFRTTYLPEDITFIPLLKDKNLTFLSIDSSEIKSETLYSVLIEATNLHSLKLINCPQLENFFTKFATNGLPALEELLLDSISFNPAEMAAISIAAPRLHSLSLKSIEINDEIISLSEHFRALKKLELFVCTLNDNHAHRILVAAHNLESIEIAACFGLENPFNRLQPNSLPHLQKIKLTGNELDDSSLFYLNRAAPNIKIIDLSHHHNPRALFDHFSPNGLKNLETLLLPSSKIQDADLQYISTIAPNLKMLDLSLCLHLQHPFDLLEPNSLALLETLKLVNLTSLHDSDILKIIKAAPNLRILDLSRCRHIEDPSIGLTPEILANLQIITSPRRQQPSPSVRALPSRPDPFPEIILRNKKTAGDTAETEPHFQTSRYFPGISSREYRLASYKLNEALDLEKTKAFDFEKVPVFAEGNLSEKIDGIFFVAQGDPTDFFLPSIKAGEQLGRPKIIDANGNLVAYECFYSKQIQFYKIKISPSAVSGPFWVSFFVMPPPASPLPQKIAELQNAYLTSPESSSLSCLERSCQVHEAWESHTVEALSDVLDMQIILNGCHAYPEFKIRSSAGETWCRVELGGTPATVEENTLPPPPITTSSEPAADCAAASSAFIQPHDAKANTLFLFDKEQRLEKLYHQFGESLVVFSNLEDLTINSKELTREGELKENHSKLARALQKHAEELIIAVDIRSLSNIAGQLNDLLDRKISGLPSTVQVIVIDSKKQLPIEKIYGQDFIRRFSTITFSEEDKAIVELAHSAADQTAQESFLESENIVEIDLYHSPYCLDRLLGQFILNDAGLFEWKNGFLASYINADSANLPQKIIFKNPPNLPEFQTFLDQWKGKNIIELADEEHYLHCPLIETREVEYDTSFIDVITKIISLPDDHDAISDTPPLVLSSTNLSDFIDSRYQIKPFQTGISLLPSHLDFAKHHSSPLHIILSPELNKDSLVEFLMKAKYLNVSVIIYEYLPSPLWQDLHINHEDKKIIPDLQNEPSPHSYKTACFSDDPATLARTLYQDAQVDILIEASTLQAGELSHMLISLSESIDLTQLRAEKSELMTAMESKKTVALYGSISDQIRDELMEICLNPDLAPYLRLILPREEQAFIQYLLPKNKIDFNIVKQKQHASSYLFTTPLYFDEEIFSLELDKARLHKINAVLAHSPFVVIQGSTGVGKSEFVKTLMKKSGKAFFTNLLDWLKAAPGAILFLDEANLSATLTQDFIPRFENAWHQNPPVFFWEGKFYDISQKYLMAAQNPAHYGNSRKNYSFLTESAACIEFDPLPTSYVHEALLLNSGLPDGILDYFLQPYEWISQRQTLDNMLITPRDVTAMLTFLLTRIKLEPAINASLETLKVVARDIAFSVAQQCLLKAPALLEEFKSMFSSSTTLHQALPTDPTGQFIFETHHCEPFARLQELVSAHEAGLKTGLNGLYLEGLSDIGKTAFLEASLRIMNRPYVTLSSHQSLSEMQEALKEASEQKSILLFNEINTSVLLEKSINEALDNGCLLLASGNPKSLFQDRHDLGDAIESRLFQIDCTRLNWIKKSAAPKTFTPSSPGLSDLYSLFQKEWPEARTKPRATSFV